VNITTPGAQKSISSAGARAATCWTTTRSTFCARCRVGVRGLIAELISRAHAAARLDIRLKCADSSTAALPMQQSRQRDD
jgi:hypothetical protein